MAEKIELLRYDPATKAYTARLTVTDAEGGVVGTYTCEGTWKDGTEQMIAGSLYDQHKKWLETYAAETAEKATIELKITDAVTKLATISQEVG